MKFLFVHDSHMEPLGCLYLMAAVAKAVGEARLMRIYYSGHYWEEDKERISTYTPDFIGYSCVTGNHQKMLRLNQKLKKFLKFTSIFGGPHVTFFPEIANEEGVDLICRGEGENFVQFLVEHPPDTWEHDYYRPNYVHICPDLGLIPFPARPYPSQISHFITSRGCPYACHYCYNSKAKEIGLRFRQRSVDNVIEEIITLPDPKFVYFQDDTFGFDIKWLKEFTRKYIQFVHVPFHCHIRPEIPLESIELLAEAGCRSVHIGVEAANDLVRWDMLGRHHSKSVIRMTVRMLQKYGIGVMTQNMIGLTGDIKDDLDTLRFNAHLEPTYAWCSIYQPYPGTKLGDEMIKKYGIKVNDFPDDFFTRSIIPWPKEYKKQIEVLSEWFGFFIVTGARGVTGEILLDMYEADGSAGDTRNAIRDLADEKLYGFKLDKKGYGE